VVDRLATLGFDPAVVTTEGGVTVAFTHCPFRDLAEAHPELVCSLHRGLVEGLVREVGGGEVSAFRDLVDRDPCQVDLVPSGQAAGGM
jgi:predicted ArsR family transcriptional regulator